MKKEITFSTLFHFLVIAIAIHLALSKPAKSFYAVDLSIGGFEAAAAVSQETGSWKRPSPVIAPKESEDFLKKPTEKSEYEPEEEPEEILPSQRAKPKSGKANVGAGRGMSRFPYPAYTEIIRKKIALNWQANFWRSNLLERDAQVVFYVKRNGSISGLELTEKSGDSSYDLTCLRSVELSAPFPPLPQGLGKEEIRIVFDFEISD